MVNGERGQVKCRECEPSGVARLLLLDEHLFTLIGHNAGLLPGARRVAAKLWNPARDRAAILFVGFSKLATEGWLFVKITNNCTGTQKNRRRPAAAWNEMLPPLQ